MDFEPVRLGFVGVGSYGRYLGKMASASPMIEVAAVHDIDPAAMDRFRQEVGGRYMSSYEEMLSDIDIEGIVLCTPTQYHARHSLLAASAGKHVFIDQPMANSVKTSREIITAMQTTGLTLMVGLNSRRNIAIRQLRVILEQGLLGRTLMAEGNFSSMLGFDLTPDHWRYHSRTCPGGPLMDLGIHIIDIFNFLFEQPAEVLAMANRLTGHTESFDTVSLLTRYENGVQAYIGSSFVSPTTHFLRVYGTVCNAVISGSSGEIELHYPDGTKEKPKIETPFDGFREYPTQYQELDEFAYCIRTGQRPETDGWAGLFAMAVIEGAIRSASTGQIEPLYEYIKPLDGQWSPGETG